MDTAKAHIKLQTWEWIPDQTVSACRVIVYNPDTTMPVYEALTSLSGYLEFDIEPGLYVIWVFGHNPVGYRPFLSDTWIPIAVLPGETKEVCAALVSLIDIPVLYQAVQGSTTWEPTTFAELLGEYAEKTLAECTRTAIQQRLMLEKAVGELPVVAKVDRPVNIRPRLLQRRRKWAEQAVELARQYAPQSVAEAKAAGAQAVDVIEKRMRALAASQPCEEIGPVTLDFSQLPYGPGPLPPTFIFEKVEFTRIWNTIQMDQGTLWCYGSDEYPPGMFHDAAVKLSFAMLPCLVSYIAADVEPHGPEARLEAYLYDGSTLVDACHGEGKQTLTLKSDPDNPFVSVILSGQEAEWFGIHFA